MKVHYESIISLAVKYSLLPRLLPATFVWHRVLGKIENIFSHNEQELYARSALQDEILLGVRYQPSKFVGIRDTVVDQTAVFHFAY